MTNETKQFLLKLQQIVKALLGVYLKLPKRSYVINFRIRNKNDPWQEQHNKVILIP